MTSSNLNQLIESNLTGNVAALDFVQKDMIVTGISNAAGLIQELSNTVNGLAVDTAIIAKTASELIDSGETLTTGVSIDERVYLDFVPVALKRAEQLQTQLDELVKNLNTVDVLRQFNVVQPFAKLATANEYDVVKSLQSGTRSFLDEHFRNAQGSDITAEWFQRHFQRMTNELANSISDVLGTNVIGGHDHADADLVDADANVEVEVNRPMTDTEAFLAKYGINNVYAVDVPDDFDTDNTEAMAASVKRIMKEQFGIDVDLDQIHRIDIDDMANLCSGSVDLNQLVQTDKPQTAKPQTAKPQTEKPNAAPKAEPKNEQAPDLEQVLSDIMSDVLGQIGSNPIVGKMIAKILR